MNCTDSVNFTIHSNDSDLANKDSSGDDWDIGLKIMFPITCSVVPWTSIVLLNTFLKDLNQWIKNILTILSVHMALSSFISASILFFWKDNSFEKCGTLHIISITNGFVTLDNLALISFMKCYLARKTAQLEGINVLLVIGLTVLIYVGEYGFCIGMEVTTITSFTASCMKEVDIGEPKDEDKYLKGLKLFKMLATLGIGFASDVSLFLFLRKKNQVQPALNQDQLVPWKSSNEKDYNYNVPVGASTITTITAFVIGILFTALSSESFQNAFDLLYPMSFLLPTLLLSTMLGLTIRTAWNQKPKPQIPQGPCFHDQSEEGVHDIELNFAEINDVEVECTNPTE